MQPQIIRLTGQAHKFLNMLVDFGHLDEGGYQRVLAIVGGQFENVAEVTCDIALARRAAAVVVSQAAEEDALGQGLLREDWPLLFS